jgi:hypothetical protein
MELIPSGWIGEGEADRQRLTETKGTVWIVFFFLPPLRFGVFNTVEDAQQFFEEQLHDDFRKPLQPVRYVDGKQFVDLTPTKNSRPT